MTADPFRIAGPAVISFSGGRTSAYLLWRVLQAHGGTLPPDVLVCFANTGREMPATLDFVRDCGAAWNVPITWLEYTWKPGGPGVRTVSHNSASRDGKPFAALLAAKQMLPNPIARFCSIEMKIQTQARFLRSLGWTGWTNVIGLRADEERRVMRALGPGKARRQRWRNACPLAAAGVTQSDVFAFWKRQPFDLQLRGPWEGNCDGCFLKSRAATGRMLKDHPERMAWWAMQEVASKHRPTSLATAGAVFRKDREDYAAMARIVRDQGSLPFAMNERVIPCDDAGCGI